MTGVGEALQGVYQHRTAAVGRQHLGRGELKLVDAGLPWLVVLLVISVLIVGHRCRLLSGCP
jgi:hypothetical protein